MFIRRAHLVTLSIGMGWILGISVMMLIMPLSGASAFEMTFLEAIGNTIVFGFPGFLMLMIAIILAVKNNDPNGPFKGDF